MEYDYFLQGYPEELDGHLDSVSASLCCCFNKSGSLIAIGSNDGRIYIWDFITKTVLKSILAHSQPVTSLNWSRDSLLLSGSSDWTVHVWDIESSKPLNSFKFNNPVSKVQFHPRNNNVFLVCFIRDIPVLIERSSTTIFKIPNPDNEEITTASFYKRGKHILFGNSNGNVYIYEIDTNTIVKNFKISLTSSSAIKNIDYSRNSGLISIVSHDRTIRLYNFDDIMLNNLDQINPKSKFLDLVNRTSWKKCCFSPDGQYIMAASLRQHSLYIWETSNSTLVKILNGNKGEICLDIAWHPSKPIVCSISNSLVYIWGQILIEKWSAFAPNFVELEENIEYVEHESEFDLEDEDKELNKHTLIQSNNEQYKNEDTDDETIDIDTIDKPFFCSSDENGDESYLFLIPVITDMDHMLDNKVNTFI